MTEDIRKFDDSVKDRNPEWIRVTTKDIVNEIAASISLSDFQQIVTTLKDRSSTAKSLYNMQKNNIINDIHQSVDTMYEKNEVDIKYNEITKLIKESTANKDTIAWRPVTGDCNAQLAAYRKKCLMEKKSYLEELLQQERNTRLQLKDTLDKKRSNLESLTKQMDTAKLKLIESIEYYND